MSRKSGQGFSCRVHIDQITGPSISFQLWVCFAICGLALVISELRSAGLKFEGDPAAMGWSYEYINAPDGEEHHFPVLLVANALVAAVAGPDAIGLAAFALLSTWWLANRLAGPFHRWVELPAARLDPRRPAATASGLGRA